MSRRSDWQELWDRRMAEAGAAEAYEATRRGFESGYHARRDDLAGGEASSRKAEADIIRTSWKP